MGQAVTKAIVDLQLKHDKPIGLGIIGPGAKPEHIEPRIEPHARAAISAISSMLWVFSFFKIYHHTETRIIACGQKNHHSLHLAPSIMKSLNGYRNGVGKKLIVWPGISNSMWKNQGMTNTHAIYFGFSWFLAFRIYKATRNKITTIVKEWDHW